MTTRNISADGVLLARFISADDWGPGLSFHSADADFIQVGTWSYDGGRQLQAHRHNYLPRSSTRTQELVFIRRGRMTATVYDEGGRLVEEVAMGPGDMLILLAGGHGYQIDEDGTQVLEVKNGPYFGAEADRVRFGSLA